MRGWESVFAPLKAPMGKYAILGNHDYGNYSRWPSESKKAANFRGITDGYRRLGFQLLRNESLVLSRNGDRIGLAGVENWGSASFPQTGDERWLLVDSKNKVFAFCFRTIPTIGTIKFAPRGFLISLCRAIRTACSLVLKRETFAGVPPNTFKSAGQVSTRKASSFCT